MLRFLYLFCLVLLAFSGVREPLTANFSESAACRWLNKKIIESRSLDQMENLDHWHSFTTSGGPVVDARIVTKILDSSGSVARISLTAEKIHAGSRSLLMETPTKLEGPAPRTGRGWGRSGIRRLFEDEDWTKFNRVSIWIYPELPGFYTTALDFRLYNDGVIKMPALFGQEGETSLILRNHEWNHVVWEIGNVARDKITGFEMSYGLSGNMPEEADNIRFYFDQLDLEQVEADKVEGWDVWPGRISFSHAGYQTGAVKTAVCNKTDAKKFQLINQETGAIVLTKPIEHLSSHIGSFQVMDFSEVRIPGNYILQAGNIATPSFRIGADVWEETIWKALNFFYAERCGMEVPGVHSVCHRDWTCSHNDQHIIINGGWHDAGDLTQGLENTGEIDYALFSMAEKLDSRNDNPALYDRVLEEAKWGLDWVLKTSFHDGYRNGGSISSRRTNGILGDLDDITTTARNNPMTNFEAAAVEAIGSRVLKTKDPRLAALALKMAEEDWNFAVAGMQHIKPSAEIWRGSFDSDNVEHELAAQAIICSVDLWKLTGNKKYSDKAVELAGLILNSQQRKRTNWDIPLNGFYYTNTSKNRLLHYCHRGREQGATLALTELCNAFPEHPDYMKWYSAVTLYSEYLKTISKYTQPFDVLPASVYVDTEYLHVPESRKESFRKQVLNGVDLGKGHYLRLFPVWMDYRGHFGTILPQAQSLAAAGQLRGDLASARLSEHQLEWIIGKNPFSQSTMWGEGHDFAPLYTPSSGDIVGALPVGIQSRGEDDAPYWPVQNTWTYKEIWVHPVTRWIWLLKDIAGSPIIEGTASAPIELKERITGEKSVIDPDRATGHFKTRVPEGDYTITTNGQSQLKSFLPGASYQLDLRNDRLVTFDVSSSTSSNGEVTMKIKAHGSGPHYFTIKSDNLTSTTVRKDLLLQTGKEGIIEWKSKIKTIDEPWIALVYVDGEMGTAKEERQ